MDKFTNRINHKKSDFDFLRHFNPRENPEIDHFHFNLKFVAGKHDDEDEDVKRKDVVAAEEEKQAHVAEKKVQDDVAAEEAKEDIIGGNAYMTINVPSLFFLSF